MQLGQCVIATYTVNMWTRTVEVAEEAVRAPTDEAGPGPQKLQKWLVIDLFIESGRRGRTAWRALTHYKLMQ